MRRNTFSNRAWKSLCISLIREPLREMNIQGPTITANRSSNTKPITASISYNPE